MNDNRNPRNVGNNPRKPQPSRQMGGQNVNGQHRPTNNNRPAANNGSSNGGMKRINTQTPANRRAQQHKKMQMTSEQIAINRSNLQREKYYIKKNRRKVIKTFIARALMFAAIFCLLLAICAGLFACDLTKVESEDSSGYTYIIDGEKSTLSYKNAVRDGRVYISFTDIAEMCDMAVTGSDSDMKFVIKGDDTEMIRFVTDSRVVYVNGIETRLGSDCYRIAHELYVPVDFVSTYFNGLTIVNDESAHKITVERVITNLDEKGKLPKGTEPEYEPLSFLLKSTAGIEPLGEKEENKAETPDLGFLTNLSAYEEYMNPGNTTEFLDIVSVNSKLASNYVPQDLMALADTRDDGRQIQMMRKNAAMSMEAMFIELRAAGYDDVSITSAYRSYSYQETLFNQYLKQYNNDYEYVSTFSNPPGSSEHQTGLCADLHNLSSADIAFSQEEAYTWLRHNCWKFGFILRYPDDKTDITGISFEPWHYRYVGRYHAQRIYQAGMCLEEYVKEIGT